MGTESCEGNRPPPGPSESPPIPFGDKTGKNKAKKGNTRDGGSPPRRPLWSLLCPMARHRPGGNGTRPTGPTHRPQIFPSCPQTGDGCRGSGGCRAPCTAGTRCSTAGLAVLPVCREGDSRLPPGSASTSSGRRGARGELGEPAEPKCSFFTPSLLPRPTLLLPSALLFRSNARGPQAPESPIPPSQPCLLQFCVLKSKF